MSDFSYKTSVEDQDKKFVTEFDSVDPKTAFDQSLSKDDKFEIQCPKCKRIFVINPRPGIDELKMNCTGCNFEARVKDYKYVGRVSSVSKIQAPGVDNEGLVYTSVPGSMPPQAVRRIGKLVDMTDPRHIEYPLRIGDLIVGRKADLANDIQIITEDNYMSRLGIKIRVVETASGYIHSFYNYKHTNPTYIMGDNGFIPILDEQVYIITGDEQFKLGRSTFKFIVDK